MAKVRYVTDMDKLTINDIQKALDSLESRSGVSDSTKNKVDSLTKKYTAQRNKTLRLYEKNKKKEKLKGINKSTLSVKKIYDLVHGEGHTQDVGEHNWWHWHSANQGENLCAVVGGALAINGALTLGEGAGYKFIGKTIVNACKAMFTNGPWTAVASSLLLSGGALLAGSLIKKAIRKSQEANAFERSETEKAINKGTVYDHDNLATNEADLIDEAATGNADDNATYQHLVEVSTNANNSPSVIKAANKILAGARAKRAETSAKVQQAQLESQCDKEENRGAIIDKIKLDNAKELISVANQTITISGTPAAGSLGVAISTILSNFNGSDKPKREEAIKTALNKTEDEFVAAYTIESASETTKSSARALYRKLKAAHQISTMEACGEIELDDSDLTKITKVGGKSVNDINNNYYRKLIKAAKDAKLDIASMGIPSGNDKDDAEKIEAKYGTQIANIKRNMQNEMDAAEMIAD